jgi:hypothetical protein
LGLTYYHQRKFQEAINELLLSLVGQPTNIGSHVILADAYHFAGQEEEAATQWEEVYRLSGDNKSVAQIQSVFERGGFAALADGGSCARRRWLANTITLRFGWQSRLVGHNAGKKPCTCWKRHIMSVRHDSSFSKTSRPLTSFIPSHVIMRSFAA